MCNKLLKGKQGTTDVHEPHFQIHYPMISMQAWDETTRQWRWAFVTTSENKAGMMHFCTSECFMEWLKQRAQVTETILNEENYEFKASKAIGTL